MLEAWTAKCPIDLSNAGTRFVFGIQLYLHCFSHVHMSPLENGAGYLHFYGLLHKDIGKGLLNIFRGDASCFFEPFRPQSVIPLLI